ncbi:hypothetical protein PSECIP111951_00052 [Pseudoalteromonas holothuriae]|uniref:Uncharacterized protein n=1 Tax=Pseudoalteromonas holothuriae TaxID=2963714 RepID=A0A9W4QU20_9GAMM|nr:MULTISPECIES: YwqJ-related putative deaminase [unclassified Pseudoalteromonas]CAH9049845.1 hypothetical protein PSECIP111951_00052 [Pseudoalteromonas sp. CIP111951]CAH9052920.1 hypothetical protein PSECIP111854_01068 [Pseudoalteromonas sp. CIP111854]
MKKSLLLALLLGMPSTHILAAGEGACALPSAGEEIVTEDFRGGANLSAEQRLRQEVSQEARYWSLSKSNSNVFKLSKSRLRSAAAYAKAETKIGDQLMQTEGHINIPVRYSNVKNESWITTVESGDGESLYRINDIDKYMDRVEVEYAKLGERVNPLTRKYIQEYLLFENDGETLWTDGGRLLSEPKGLPGMHAEVQAFNRILNLSEDAGVVLSEGELNSITLATARVNALENLSGIDFGACPNCYGILSRTGINIVTDDF